MSQNLSISYTLGDSCGVFYRVSSLRNEIIAKQLWLSEAFPSNVVEGDREKTGAGDISFVFNKVYQPLDFITPNRDGVQGLSDHRGLELVVEDAA